VPAGERAGVGGIEAGPPGFRGRCKQATTAAVAAPLLAQTRQASRRYTRSPLRGIQRPTPSRPLF
jgi:hypothetical protein